MAGNISLILAIAVGALVYAIMIYFMKIPEVDRTLVAIKKIFEFMAEENSEE